METGPQQLRNKSELGTVASAQNSCGPTNDLYSQKKSSLSTIIMQVHASGQPHVKCNLSHDFHVPSGLHNQATFQTCNQRSFNLAKNSLTSIYLSTHLGGSCSLF